MSTDIELLRQQAQQYDQLRRAAEQLPQVEAAAAAEQRQQQAEAAAQQARVEFDQQMVDFQAAKLESDSTLASWLADGVKLIERRQALAARADALAEMARRLAYAQLAAGIVRSPLGRSDAVRCEAEELLKRATGYSKLMTYPGQSGPAGVLLDGVITYTGDVVTSPGR